MSDDIETRLTTLLRERAEDVDFDAGEWRSRLEAAPAPSRKRLFAGAALGLGVAAGLVAALTIGGGFRDTKPTPDTPAATTSRFTPLAGSWRLTEVDGVPVQGDGLEGSVTFAEAGWWRADAGCVRIGGWFDWAPATGDFAARDWQQPEVMPPKDKADCYRPTVLSALWPGRRLVRSGDDLRVLDQQGVEQARLRLVDGESYRAPRLTGPAAKASSTWRVTGVDGSTTVAGGLDLGGSPAPWTQLAMAVDGDRIGLTLTRPAGTGPECRLARLDAELAPDGRLAGAETDVRPRGIDGAACPVYPGEQPLIDALPRLRALATVSRELVGLGDGGTEVLGLEPLGSVDTTSSRPIAVTDARLVHGTWWVGRPEEGQSRSASDVLQVRLSAPAPDTVAVVVEAGCGIVGQVTATLAPDGRLTVEQEPVPGACPAAAVPAEARAALNALRTATSLLLSGGVLTVQGAEPLDLLDLPPIPGDVVINEPQPDHPATVEEMIGDWRLDYARLDAADARTILGSKLGFKRDATRGLTLGAYGCNFVSGPMVLTGGRVLDSRFTTTLKACGPRPGELVAPRMWFDDRIAEARSYAMTADGRLLVLSRDNHPILGFGRAD